MNNPTITFFNYNYKKTTIIGSPHGFLVVDNILRKEVHSFYSKGAYEVLMALIGYLEEHLHHNSTVIYGEGVLEFILYALDLLMEDGQAKEEIKEMLLF